MAQTQFSFDPDRFMIDDILDVVKEIKREQKKKKKPKKKKKNDSKVNIGVIKNNTDNYYLKSRKS